MANKNVNNILFQFLSSTKGLEKGTRQATKSLGGVQSAAKKMAGTLGLAFGAREVVRFGQDAVEAAVSYEESLNAVEVATGRASNAIFKIGETSAESLGIGKLALNQAAVAFAGFAKQIDSTDTAALFEELLTRATDFASVYEIEVAQALEVFQSTLAGQSKPIRAYGKDLSAASVKAFALANGIGDANRELTEGEKVQARYGLLLQETTDVAGDFANTIGSTANQQKIANEQMDDAKILLGKELIPLQREWTNIQRRFVIPALIAVTDELGRIADGQDTMAQGFKDARDTGNSFIDQLLGIAATGQGVADMLGFFLTPGLAQMRDAADEAADAYNKRLEPAMTDLADTSVTYRNILGDLDGAAGGVADGLGDAADAQDELNAALTRFQVPGVWDRFVSSVRNIGLNLAAAQRGQGVGGGRVQQLAHGGTIQPGGVALVGEQGPEIIQPRGGAKITPMNKARGGGGTTVNVSFNGIVGDPVEAAQMVVDLIELHGRTNAG